MKKVAIVMGSTSDLTVMNEAIEVLKELGVETEVDIVSAHRTPEKLFEFSKNAHLKISGSSLPEQEALLTSLEWLHL